MRDLTGPDGSDRRFAIWALSLAAAAGAVLLILMAWLSSLPDHGAATGTGGGAMVFWLAGLIGLGGLLIGLSMADFLALVSLVLLFGDRRSSAAFRWLSLAFFVVGGAAFGGLELCWRRAAPGGRAEEAVLLDYAMCASALVVAAAAAAPYLRARGTRQLKPS